MSRVFTQLVILVHLGTTVPFQARRGSGPHRDDEVAVAEMSSLRSFQDSWLEHPVEALILVFPPSSAQEAISRKEVASSSSRPCWKAWRCCRIVRHQMPSLAPFLPRQAAHRRRRRHRRLDGRGREPHLRSGQHNGFGFGPGPVSNSVVWRITPDTGCSTLPRNLAH